MDSFSPEQVAGYFSINGRMAQHIHGYRYRQEQVKLAESIARSFLNSEFLVSETGTGVGKTYAYLIPAILWALDKKEKVVISTRTRALQQQLTSKDIPEIKKVLDCEFNVAEAKGRENYICWNKYMKILAGRKKLEIGEQAFIESILRWAEETKNGDRKELSLDSSLMKYWYVLSADRKSCLRDNCSFHEKCFRLKMLRSLEKADLIVTNHALLLSDIQAENSILPQYRYLIIDEAHTFDRLAFDHLSLRFSLSEISELLQMLYSREKGYERGYLQLLKGKYQTLQPLITETVNILERNLEIIFELFTVLNSNTVKKDQNFNQIINWQDHDSKWLNQAMDIYLDWQGQMNLLLTKLSSIKEKINDTNDNNELTVYLQSLDESSYIATTVMEENLERDDIITWLEYNHGQVVSVASSSLDTGIILNQRLYHNKESIIMVSATLATEGHFDYFISKMGLNALMADERVNTLLQQSPFNYDKQAELLIINDIPEPSQRDFIGALASTLSEIILTIKGKILVLFTARTQLNEIAKLLKPYCNLHYITLLVQYEDGEYNHLINEYLHNPRAVLMGVETFWEGIDLKGDALKCVVIVRLPFRSPSDPYCIAADRSCRLAKKNSFQHFMLPDATVRFKQGTGRLIRSEDDRGIVIVLDSRLENKPYSNVFKNSIPINNTHLLTRKHLQAYLKDYFK
ncbi:MAG: ATP-dependent DNA helicase [Syntrophomonadaceae bacterium]